VPSPRVLLVFAHPAYERARVNPALARAAEGAPGVTVHDLYETYPDFLIDVEAEQRRLLDHQVIALQYPMYWYSSPALLKEWLDLVWLHGFAYGQGGTKLRGKALFCALTTGGQAKAYGPAGGNRFSVAEFLRPMEQTAHLCGMRWLEPFVVHGAATLSDAELNACTAAYVQRLAGLAQERGD
jgi:glutathione-regulated potassium-efflux system ancillary protein KefG